MALRLPRLPTVEASWANMQRWWQSVVEAIERAVSDLEQAILDIQAAMAAAEAAQTTADEALAEANTKQPADDALTALSGLPATLGALEQTGTDTFAIRAIGVGTSVSLITRADGDTRYAPSATIGLTDGDKGDVVVSASGATWNLDSSVVTTFARSILDDVDAAAVRATIGVGTIATQNANAVAITGGTFTGMGNSSIGAGTGSPFVTINGGTGTAGPYFSMQKGGSTIGYYGTDSGINGNNNNHLAIYSASNNVLIYAAGALRGTFSSAGLDIVGLLQCDTLRLDSTPTAAAVAQTHYVPININGTTYKWLLST